MSHQVRTLPGRGNRASPKAGLAPKSALLGRGSHLPAPFPAFPRLSWPRKIVVDCRNVCTKAMIASHRGMTNGNTQALNYNGRINTGVVLGKSGNSTAFTTVPRSNYPREGRKAGFGGEYARGGVRSSWVGGGLVGGLELASAKAYRVYSRPQCARLVLIYRIRRLHSEAPQ
jgi:hypothetical protein